MKKTLWIVDGAFEALEGIRLAKEMGLHVVVSDLNPDAPGFALADDRVMASPGDVEGTMVAALRYHRSVRSIDGILSVVADVPVTVASVALELHLPGIPLQAAQLGMNKFDMKLRLHSDKVSIPWFSEVEGLAHLARLVAEQEKALVIKPIDSRGSRGVLRLGRKVDLEWAYRIARAQSPSGRVMVEHYLDGPQISTQALVVNGVAHTVGLSDRNYEHLETYAPHFIENGGRLPSYLPEKNLFAIRELMQRAADSLKIENGVLKGDLVVHQDRPCLIELATRLSGGFFATHQIPLCNGIRPVEIAILLALGNPVPMELLQPRFQREVVRRLLLPRPGRIQSIAGVDRAKAITGVAEVIVTVKPGDVIHPPHHSGSYAGTVMAVADTRKLAEARCREAEGLIRIETEPVGDEG